MVNSKIDELQSFAKRVFVASRPAGPRGPPPRQPTPRPQGQPAKPEGHHLREAVSLAAAAPANDARASAAAMMWELLGEGRRLLEDGEWRRQPPRLA